MKKMIIALALAAVGLTGHAQPDYPQKPLRIIVPYPVGGAADVISRHIGQVLTRRTNQPVIIENRGGASGMIGATACKRAPADGYTFCMLFSDILAINPFIFKNIAYDAEKDFAPVVHVVNVDGVIVAPTAMPANNLRELIAYAKANPGKINWASIGVGSSPHLVLEKINKSAGVDMKHVPYQGGGPVTTALMANEVDVTMSGYGLVAPHIKGGKMKAFAALGAKRSPLIPDIPTLAEQGVDFTGTLWLGLFAPAGTSATQVNVINKLVNETLTDQTFVQQNLSPGGYAPTGGSPQALSERVRKDQQEWGSLAKGLNLALE